MLVGVNTHFNYNDGKYNWSNDFTPTVEKVKWLGVHEVRDHAPVPGKWWVEEPYKHLRDAGIKLAIMTGGPIAETVANARSILPNASIARFEGPNEPNNSGWTGDAVQYMRDLKAAVLPVPVAGICSWPEIGAPSDFMNLHPYSRGAGRADPKLAIAANLQSQIHAEDAAARLHGYTAPSKFVISEIGFGTKDSNEYGAALTEEQQANYLIASLEYAKQIGCAAFDVYELIDDRPNSLGMGLWSFHDDPRQMKPKLAATAVRDWIARQAAPAPAPAPVTPSPVPTPPAPTVPAGELRTRLDKARLEVNGLKNAASRALYAIDKAIDGL